MLDADVKKRFGLAIKNWRAKSDISQEELAWRAGLHRSYVADIERGARNASLQSIEKLAKAFEVSLSALFHPLGDVLLSGLPLAVVNSRLRVLRHALGLFVELPALVRFPNETVILALACPARVPLGGALPLITLLAAP